jgi:hypothetical protein
VCAVDLECDFDTQDKILMTYSSIETETLERVGCAEFIPCKPN